MLVIRDAEVNQVVGGYRLTRLTTVLAILIPPCFELVPRGSRRVADLLSGTEQYQLRLF